MSSYKFFDPATASVEENNAYDAGVCYGLMKECDDLVKVLDYVLDKYGRNFVLEVIANALEGWDPLQEKKRLQYESERYWDNQPPL